jgi:hypothetical protein
MQRQADAVELRHLAGFVAVAEGSAIYCPTGRGR